ncbi:uncharacterized protein ccdc15 isoform X1 [Nerophis lumbriciformis]|uniref:uncharacterized protein ccdc15 isoform X1 n=1 Tax=Nerophis lumbriciformis TaxID=546530 RepID=UPI002AE06369|nr:coiled-coil domain-containing protein 15 isoform X1 [Nerophis lumbriciformis]
MFARRAKTVGDKSPSRRRKVHGTNKVMAERNQTVVAVGAWVEDGQDFEENPCDLASYTDELQADRMREREVRLRRFQEDVRHRVAVIRKCQETQPGVDKRIPKQHHHLQWTQRETDMSELRDGARQIRLRLAARGTSLCDEGTSQLPADSWNISLSRHEDDHIQEEEEGGRDHLPVVREEHKCPLVRQPASRSRRVVDQSEPDLKSSARVPKVVWPLQDQETLRRQQQSHFLTQRRRFMSADRERVKQSKQHRKHLKKTDRLKAGKEKARLEEERRLERTRQLTQVRQRLEEREVLILERLKLEEEERAAEVERRKRPEKSKVTTRYVEALRAQLKQKMSNKKLDFPPLCCCASSFWDSHPDSCANNCIFHNNPKEYAQALHSAVLTLDL